MGTTRLLYHVVAINSDGSDKIINIPSEERRIKAIILQLIAIRRLYLSFSYTISLSTDLGRSRNMCFVIDNMTRIGVASFLLPTHEYYIT